MKLSEATDVPESATRIFWHNLRVRSGLNLCLEVAELLKMILNLPIRGTREIISKNLLC